MNKNSMTKMKGEGVYEEAWNETMAEHYISGNYAI